MVKKKPPMHIATTKFLHIRFGRAIFWLQWILLSALLALYAYFIVMSVVQVVLRQELLVAIQEAETQVSQLEAEYFEHSNDLSQETALALGFVELSPVAYVHVAPEGDRISRRP